LKNIRKMDTVSAGLNPRSPQEAELWKGCLRKMTVAASKLPDLIQTHAKLLKRPPRKKEDGSATVTSASPDAPNDLATRQAAAKAPMQAIGARLSAVRAALDGLPEQCAYRPLVSSLTFLVEQGEPNDPSTQRELRAAISSLNKLALNDQRALKRAADFLALRASAGFAEPTPSADHVLNKPLRDSQPLNSADHMMFDEPAGPKSHGSPSKDLWDGLVSGDGALEPHNRNLSDWGNEADASTSGRSLHGESKGDDDDDEDNLVAELELLEQQLHRDREDRGDSKDDFDDYNSLGNSYSNAIDEAGYSYHDNDNDAKSLGPEAAVPDGLEAGVDEEEEASDLNKAQLLEMEAQLNAMGAMEWQNNSSSTAEGGAGGDGSRYDSAHRRFRAEDKAAGFVDPDARSDAASSPSWTPVRSRGSPGRRAVSPLLVADAKDSGGSSSGNGNGGGASSWFASAMAEQAAAAADAGAVTAAGAKGYESKLQDYDDAFMGAYPSYGGSGVLGPFPQAEAKDGSNTDARSQLEQKAAANEAEAQQRRVELDRLAAAREAQGEAASRLSVKLKQLGQQLALVARLSGAVPLAHEALNGANRLAPALLLLKERQLADDMARLKQCAEDLTALVRDEPEFRPADASTGESNDDGSGNLSAGATTSQGSNANSPNKDGGSGRLLRHGASHGELATVASLVAIKALEEVENGSSSSSSSSHYQDSRSKRKGKTNGSSGWATTVNALVADVDAHLPKVRADSKRVNDLARSTSKKLDGSYPSSAITGHTARGGAAGAALVSGGPGGSTLGVGRLGGGLGLSNGSMGGGGSAAAAGMRGDASSLGPAAAARRLAAAQAVRNGGVGGGAGGGPNSSMGGTGIVGGNGMTSSSLRHGGGGNEAKGIGWDMAPERETGHMVVVRKSDGLAVRPRHNHDRKGPANGGDGLMVSKHCGHVPSSSDLQQLSLGGSSSSGIGNSNSHHSSSTMGGSGLVRGSRLQAGHKQSQKQVKPSKALAHDTGGGFGLTGFAVGTQGGGGNVGGGGMPESSGYRLDSTSSSFAQAAPVGASAVRPPELQAVPNSNAEAAAAGSSPSSTELDKVVCELGDSAKSFVAWFVQEEGHKPTADMVRSVLSNM